MAASQHTPGPWKLHSSTEGDPRTGDGSFCITGPFGGVIANIVPPDWHETPATARLIAASPTLVDALVGLTAWFGERDYDEFESGMVDESGLDWVRLNKVLDRAEAAIAKAKGGE